MKHSSFDTDSPQFLDEGGLADAVACADLDIFGLPFGVELLENRADFPPFPVDAGRVDLSELDVNVVCLSEAWR